MQELRILLFGKFSVQWGNQELETLEGGKVQELFTYLLLYRNRPHPRESLATLLWRDSPVGQSKSYLRKTLWQLQTALEAQTKSGDTDLLHVDTDWIQLNAAASVWLDISRFEQAFERVCDIPGTDLSTAAADEVAQTIQLYRGDLLEGCYQEWCLFERERLQRMYLIMLEKLMNYSEAHGEFEAGLLYGTQVLRYDPARERTHRRLMRLHYLCGNRTEALRQYARCVDVLHRELDVAPARRTLALYQQILSDQLPSPNSGEPAGSTSSQATLLRNALRHLETLQNTLIETQNRIQHDIEAIELSLQDLD